MFFGFYPLSAHSVRSYFVIGRKPKTNLDPYIMGFSETVANVHFIFIIRPVTSPYNKFHINSPFVNIKIILFIYNESYGVVKPRNSMSLRIIQPL